MTVHYISDWSQYSAMLACSRLRGRHTGYAIAEEFENILSSLQIADKVLLTVTDSASNMIKAFSLPGFQDEDVDGDDDNEFENDSDNEEEELLQGDAAIYEDLNEHIPCFAHTLQLVVKDGLKQALTI